MTVYRIYTQKVDVKSLKSGKAHIAFSIDKTKEIVNKCIESQNYQRILVIESDDDKLKGNEVIDWHMSEEALACRLAEVEKIKAKEAELKAKIKELETELKKLQTMH